MHITAKQFPSLTFWTRFIPSRIGFLLKVCLLPQNLHSDGSVMVRIAVLLIAANLPTFPFSKIFAVRQISIHFSKYQYVCLRSFYARSLLSILCKVRSLTVISPQVTRFEHIYQAYHEITNTLSETVSGFLFLSSRLIMFVLHFEAHIPHLLNHFKEAYHIISLFSIQIKIFFLPSSPR